jgi:hypothetical protein
MSAKVEILVAAVWAVGCVAPACAETWTARATLDNERSTSRLHCSQRLSMPYTFQLDNNTFTATNPYG